MSEISNQLISPMKLQIDDIEKYPPECNNTDEISKPKVIEFEVLSPVNITDSRQIEIYNAISDIDNRIDTINARVAELNKEIDRLTSHADALDYTVAVASGVLCGIIDSFFVGKFDFERGKDWGNDKVNNFVIKVAQSQGYKGDDLNGAIAFLEKKHLSPGDKAMSGFGGSKQHHLRDFSHHPTIVGLFFSMLTQFTEKCYGTDVSGAFKVEPLDLPEDIKPLYIGKNLPQKIALGCVHWFFHLVSDMAGSNSTPGAGTGIPGPILSLAKEISALPIFRHKADGQNSLTLLISKLFNGTQLAQHDANGKIIKGTEIRFDLRAELGVAEELGRQAIPVIINECIVRGFYFIRRFTKEIKEKNVRHFSELNQIDFKAVVPFKNRTIVRMMTIATGTFTAVDIADASIRGIIESGGINPATFANVILRVNFVGVGRFAIAIATDVGMGIKRSKLRNERMGLNSQIMLLTDAKVFYKQADMWITAESTEKAIQEVYRIAEKTTYEFIQTWDEICEGSERRREYAEKINQNNPELANELLDILRWG